MKHDRAYEDVAGTCARERKVAKQADILEDLLEDLLEEAIDTLQWLAAGEEVVYAHDVDVVARSLEARLEELRGGSDE